MPPPTRSALCLFAAVAVLAACGRPRIEQQLKTSIDLPADCRALAIQVPTGNITVEAGAAGRVDVDAITRRIASTDAALARLEKIDFTLHLSPGTEAGSYTLATPPVPPELDPKETALILRGLLRVPADVAVSVETTRGDLAARGFTAPVTLTTEAGDLQLDSLSGATLASTEHGNCTVTGQRGSLRLRSGEGKIWAYLDAVPAGGVRLETTDSSIVCHVPPDASFDLDARVEQSPEGKVSIRAKDLDVPVVAEGRGHVARGPVRGGGPTLRIVAGRGWISVVGR